jgi:hypothetical protein
MPGALSEDWWPSNTSGNTTRGRIPALRVSSWEGLQGLCRGGSLWVVANYSPPRADRSHGLGICGPPIAERVDSEISLDPQRDRTPCDISHRGSGVGGTGEKVHLSDREVFVEAMAGRTASRPHRYRARSQGIPTPVKPRYQISSQPRPHRTQSRVRLFPSPAAITSGLISSASSEARMQC